MTNVKNPAHVAETAGEAENDKRAWINRWNAIEDAARDAVYTMTELLAAPSLKRMQYALGERRDALSAALNLPEAGTAWMRATPPVPAQDDDKLRIAVEALEEIKHLIKISPDVPSDDFDRGARAARLQAFDIASAALSALKSTAAQEAGE